MTDQQFTPYTPPANYQPATLQAGAILHTWCTACHGQTPHRYQPAAMRKLECTKCYPETEESK